MFKIKNAVAPEHADLWVAWNIGQGQWVTHILTDECRHYDIGGEIGSFGRVKSALIHRCGARLNRLYLSHWDYDHFLNIPGLTRSLPNVCWQLRPQAFENKKAALKILQLKIPFCGSSSSTDMSAPLIWKSSDTTDTNRSSYVTADNGVLSTGDSPISAEKKWSRELPGLQNIQVLMLGHHGSRTSSGDELLSHLPQLKWTIASARFAKYHHPHIETRRRLARQSTPILRTEVWGNIWFQTQPVSRSAD